MLLLLYTLTFASVLMLVALGGCFSEHSGVINIGLEGIMVAGALGGAFALSSVSPEFPVFAAVLYVAISSILFGTVYSLMLAVAAVNYNADQTLVGTAMNLLATALACIIVRTVNMSSDPDNVTTTIKFIQQKELMSISIFGFELSWFVIIAALLLALSYVLLYKTKFGLRLMACGEHPQAADSVGINVYKMRYAGVLISGGLGGLGGIAYITSGVSQWKFENGVAGFGFLSLAVLIFGQWKPVKIALAALLFGFFRALSNVYSGYGFLQELHLPGTFYNMLPYIISLVVLVFTSKKSHAPKAEGIPYDKGMR